MEKNVFVCESTMDMQSNVDIQLSPEENCFPFQQREARNASQDDPRCTGNHDGEEICGEGEAEGCEIQEQSQWTCQVQKLTTDPSSPWSSWSQFYLSGVAAIDVDGQPISELFKRVEPLRLRDRNAHAYTPQMFSLGPFHAKPVVSEQDRFKLSAVRSLFRESPEVFEQLVQRMLKHVFLLRSLYVDKELPEEPRTVALLFAVDAVSIVAGLVYSINAFRHRSIARDVILVENQIPVLAIKYAIQSMNLAQGKSEQPWQQLTSIVCSLLKKFSPFLQYLELEERGRAECVKKDMDERRPLLGLLYDALTARGSSSSDECYEETGFHDAEEDPSSSKKERRYSMPGAFTLEKHGLKFEAHDADFTGIRFDEAAGNLMLPKIHEMNENKQTFLLNLVAYEQNVAASSNYKPVTSYVEMMGALMKDEKDMEVLLKSGVLEKEEEVQIKAKKVAELWQQMVSSESLPHARTKADAKVEEGVRGFTDRKLNKLRAAVLTLWRGC